VQKLTLSNVIKITVVKAGAVWYSEQRKIT